MIKAVIDTNVFISALFWKGKPNEVLRLAFSKKFTAVTSREILSELEGKLTRKFHYPKNETKKYMALILSEFVVVEPGLNIAAVVEDPSDNKVIEAAADSNSGFIVTGDSHLLKLKDFRGVKILNPAEFLKILALGRWRF